MQMLVLKTTTCHSDKTVCASHRWLARPVAVWALWTLMSPGTSLLADDKPAKEAAASIKTAATALDREAKMQAIKLATTELENLRGYWQTLRDRRLARAKSIYEQCGLSPENVKPVMLELERERFMLQTSLATKPKHIRLLAERVAVTVDEASVRAKSDAILAGLEKVLVARRKLLAESRDRADAGAAPSADITKAEAELADTELRLAVRHEEFAKTSNNGDLERMNRELRELAVSQGVEEARLGELDEKLKKLQAVLSGMGDYDNLNERIATVSKQIDRLNQIILEATFELPTH